MSINTFADLRREQLRDTGPRGDLARLRQDRFEGVKAGYEADGPDSTVPGASHLIERYALVCESSRGFGYEVNYCENLVSIERAAAANIAEGWGPVCYYDLDNLDGPEPDGDVGDTVQVAGSDELFVIAMVDYEPGGEPRYIAEDTRWLLASAAEIIDRAEWFEDDRNPVRYLLAAIRTVVVFNTEPAKP